MSGRLFVHVGGPKVGSSSIQRVAGLHAHLLAERGLTLLSSTSQGWVSGAAVERMCRLAYTGYVAGGPRIFDLLKGDENATQTLVQHLAGDDRTFVLTDEALSTVHGARCVADVASQAGLDVETLLLVRPPVPWIASAWWQWGMWEGEGDLETFVRAVEGQRGHAPYWAEVAQAWAEATGRAPVVRALGPEPGRDPVSTFFQWIGAADVPTWTDHANSRIPRALAEQLLRSRWLRKDAHDNLVESVLGRISPLSMRHARPAEVALPLELQAHLLEHFSADRARLLGMMSPDEVEAVRADDRWWQVQEAPAVDAVTRASDDLLALVLEGLTSLDQRLRELEVRVKDLG